jgi:hypothetical protein
MPIIVELVAVCNSAGIAPLPHRDALLAQAMVGEFSAKLRQKMLARFGGLILNTQYGDVYEVGSISVSGGPVRLIVRVDMIHAPSVTGKASPT